LNVTIVKLGGSLACSPPRKVWLDALITWGGPFILVPGGGPFANCVRVAQDHMGFSDAAAHRMALLAMEQFAVGLAAYSDRFSLAASREEIESVLNTGNIPVWLASEMALAAPDVPVSWDMTSDSLAAWLAGTLRARRLLLVKSRDPAAAVSVHEIAADKIVDPLFPHFAARSQAEIWLAGPASLPRALQILQSGGMPGIAVACA
jgi:5-(aminomethyl)-3-furanmethanol phosphate kinase